jgi:hypothetical protein
MRKQIAGTLLVIMAASGCSPSSSDKTTPSPTHRSGSSATSPSTTGGPPMVKNSWQPGEFQQGIQVYWHTGGTESQIQTAADRVLDFVVGLGANSVGLTFPVYTDGAYPTRVYAGTDTPSTANLKLVIRAAEARGLRVELRPTIDEKNIAMTPNAWRGSLQPPDPAAWFASYGHFLGRYARLAQRYQVEEFIIGTELSSLQPQTSQWRRLKAAVHRTGFAGVVSYNFNWSGVSRMPFRQLGIDAYPSLAVADSAAVAVLSRHLKRWFRHLPLYGSNPLVAQEAGIAAVRGMYAHPWLLGNSSDQLDQSVQARWFTAMCNATHAAGLGGLYYWMLDSNVDPRHPGAQSPTGWLGRTAETSIRRCFSP